MKIATCMARARIIAFGEFYDRGDVFELPLGQALSLGDSVAIESTRDDIEPSDTVVSGTSLTAGLTAPEFDRMQRPRRRRRARG